MRFNVRGFSSRLAEGRSRKSGGQENRWAARPSPDGLKAADIIDALGARTTALNSEEHGAGQSGFALRLLPTFANGKMEVAAIYSERDRADIRGCSVNKAPTGPVENGQDDYHVGKSLIIHNIRSSGDGQDADGRFTRLPSHARVLAKPANSQLDPLRNSNGNGGLVSPNEHMDLLKVRDRAGVPFYSHLGGGSSSFRPHVSSQAATRSWERVLSEREARRRRTSST